MQMKKDGVCREVAADRVQAYLQKGDVPIPSAQKSKKAAAK